MNRWNNNCSLEKDIRDLAYQKWVNAGCPMTNEEERNRFWYEAEQEIMAKSQDEKEKPNII